MNEWSLQSSTFYKCEFFNLDGWLFSGVSDQCEGRWCSNEPDNCITCVSNGPMVEPSSGTTGTRPHSLSQVIQAYEVSTQRQTYSTVVGYVMLLCRLAFCSIHIFDVVKKVDVKHSFDWNNDSMSNHVLSWSHQQILNTQL